MGIGRKGKVAQITCSPQHGRDLYHLPPYFVFVNSVSSSSSNGRTQFSGVYTVVGLAYIIFVKSATCIVGHLNYVH